MKRHFTNIAAVLLVALVFVSSTGIPLYKHMCSAGKLYEVSFFQIEKCADKLKRQAAGKPSCCTTQGCSTRTTAGDGCCSYSSEYLSSDNDLISLKTVVFQAIALPVTTSLPTLAEPCREGAPSPNAHIADKPPPNPFGRNLLVSIQTFLN